MREERRRIAQILGSVIVLVDMRDSLWRIPFVFVFVL